MNIKMNLLGALYKRAIGYEYIDEVQHIIDDGKGKAPKRRSVKTKKHVLCIVADDLTEEQLNAFRLAYYKTHELAKWDNDKLLKKLEHINIDMIQFFFEDSESEIEWEFFEDGFDEDEKMPDVLYSKSCDIYKIGNSTTKEYLLKILVVAKIDMVFTDSPYNVDYEGAAGKIQNDKQEDSKFYEFLLAAFTNMYESVKPGGATYVCHADT